MNESLRGLINKSYFDVEDVESLTSCSEDDLRDVLIKKFKENNSFGDYILVDGFIYNMDNYDSDGMKIRYTSIDANKHFSLYTANRYESVDDLVVEFDNEVQSVRNDLGYATIFKD